MRRVGVQARHGARALLRDAKAGWVMGPTNEVRFVGRCSWFDFRLGRRSTAGPSRTRSRSMRSSAARAAAPRPKRKRRRRLPTTEEKGGSGPNRPLGDGFPARSSRRTSSGRAEPRSSLWHPTSA
jgi:hypothetical protein